MSESSTKAPSKIRTFAADIESARARRGDTPVTQAKEPDDKKTAAPTYAASPQPLRHNPDKQTEVDTPHKTVTPEKKPTPPLPDPVISSIPPFHEIDKKKKTEAAVITAAKNKEAKKQSEKNQKKAPARVNIGYDATVITDTKSDRFKLIPSIIESLQTWFKKITTKKKRVAPKYVIPEAQRRKGVIQRAASKTGTIFTADNETLKEQIRKRQQEQRLQENEEEAETNWSPYTEAGYALLEAPEDDSVPTIQNIQVEYKKPRSIPPAETTWENPPAAPVAVNTGVTDKPSQKNTSNEPSEKTETTTRKTAREKVGFYEPQTSKFDDIDEEAERSFEETASTQDTATAIKIPVQTTTLPRSQPTAISRVDTNTLTIILLGSVIVLVVMVVAGRIVFQYIQAGLSAETVHTNTTTPILRGTTLEEVLITAEATGRLQQLITTAVTTTSAGVVELSLVSPLGDEISPSYTFELLQFQTQPTFRQSLTTLRFVTVNRSEPTVLLQFTDKDTVRGGLLQWEESMAANFRRLYNLESQRGSVQFIDEQIAGVDVRVLRSETGVLLVYGFIGERTVLISKTTEDFAQISALGTR